jgi:GDP-mannose 6-dehydrogenase
VDAPLVSTSIRVAEMMKYEQYLARAEGRLRQRNRHLCKKLNVDSHEVMDIFCRDHKLNLSSYLKPGFAWRLVPPKDVRALQYRARELDSSCR